MWFEYLEGGWSVLNGEVIVKESTVPLLHVVYSAGEVSFQCDAG